MKTTVLIPVFNEDPLIEKVIESVNDNINLLINKMFNTNFKDINSGFKLIKRNVIKKTISDIGNFNYCIMTEFIIKARLNKFKVKEVRVKHFFRQKGNSRIFKIYKIPFIIFKVFFDLIYLKFKLKNNSTNV